MGGIRAQLRDSWCPSVPPCIRAYVHTVSRCVFDLCPVGLFGCRILLVIATFSWRLFCSCSLAYQHMVSTCTNIRLLPLLINYYYYYCYCCVVVVVDAIVVSGLRDVNAWAG